MALKLWPPGFFEKKFGMTLHQRARLLMEQEREEHPEQRWWYLSFAHETKGFMGGTVVEGHGFVWACNNARIMGITPGPDVQTQGMPIPPEQVPEEQHRNRLMTRAELEAVWGPMKSARELEEEQKNAE